MQAGGGCAQDATYSLVVWLKKTSLLRADAGLGTIQLPEDLQTTP